MPPSERNTAIIKYDPKELRSIETIKESPFGTTLPAAIARGHQEVMLGERIVTMPKEGKVPVQIEPLREAIPLGRMKETFQEEA
jgi:hypothetical protein